MTERKRKAAVVMDPNRPYVVDCDGYLFEVEVDPATATVRIGDVKYSPELLARFSNTLWETEPDEAVEVLTEPSGRRYFVVCKKAHPPRATTAFHVEFEGTVVGRDCGHPIIRADRIVRAWASTHGVEDADVHRRLRGDWWKLVQKWLRAEAGEDADDVHTWEPEEEVEP